jgi:hypothetical protein
MSFVVVVATYIAYKFYKKLTATKTFFSPFFSLILTSLTASPHIKTVFTSLIVRFSVLEDLIYVLFFRK